MHKAEVRMAHASDPTITMSKYYESVTLLVSSTLNSLRREISRIN